MDGKNQQSEPIDAGTVYRYVGHGYVVGLPARDLTSADVADVLQREGITEEQIRASGLYEPVEYVEIAPFCGAELEEGRCRAPVDEWGQRCPEHQEATDDTPCV